MTTDNIFSGLKVVDLASFIAGPGAAVILSDFGADVIKVEPPTGDTHRIVYRIPPQPRAKDNYAWHLDNRNKRGLTLDLKSPAAQAVLERLVKWADVLIVNTPHPARKRLKLSYQDVASWNPRLIYADVTGYGDEGPDADLPGFDLTAYWARSGILALTRDAGAPPTLPVAGSGDHATAVGLFSAIVTGLYRRERTGKGSYVTTSLLAEGVWAAGIVNAAALCDAKFFPLHDRKDPPNATLNVYRAADDHWFILVVTPDKLAALAQAIGRVDLLSDARFREATKLAANMAQLTGILDETFSAQPMAHWQDVLDRAHITYGVVNEPSQVVLDPQLKANDIVVPLEGAGGNLTSTISSPIQVHGVAKVPAQRARSSANTTKRCSPSLDLVRPRSMACAPAASCQKPNNARQPRLDRLPRVPESVKGKIMAKLQASKTKRTSVATPTIDRLFVLDLSGGKVLSFNPDGSDRKVLVEHCRLPDGIVIDAQAGHLYWTNMGIPNLNDGSIERVDLDGTNHMTIVPQGKTHTPKQIHLEKQGGKLYWCDREGMRVMRANLDGTEIETLVDTSQGEQRPGRDATKWCVGITVDPQRGQIYWTQKGSDNANAGRILRAHVEIPHGQNASNRTDIEVLFDGLPEPIDLELDLEHRILYWTDRGDPPRGNTVNRAPLDSKAKGKSAPEILFTHLMEGIGIALDIPGDRMFFTDLGGSVYCAKLDGSSQRTILFAQGNLSGIAYAEISAQET